MRIKLSYKIFMAFTLTSLMVVALMVGIMRFYISRNFSDYVTKVQLQRLDNIVTALVAEYQKHQGWEALKSNPGSWRQILVAGRQKRDFDGPATPPGPPDFGRPKPPPRPRNFPVEAGTATGKDGSPALKPKGSSRIRHKLALFDAQKHHVVGGPPGNSPVRHALREITIEGKTIGWLGVHKREHLSNPLVVGFLKQQTQAFYVIGGGILLLAAIVSFLLSKNLLAPIRKLTAGTQALTSRQFDTRIDVESKDELGQLAANFNTMAQTLEKYELMRQQWISDISHELRTPLSILRGELEAVQDGVRAVTPETLDSLHSEVLRVGKIVDDLHQLSLADTGSLSYNKEPVDPLLVLKKTLGSFRTRLEKQKIDLQDYLESDEPVTVLGDADRLTQLFSNLLENTLRYADSPGTLKLWHERIEDQLTLYLEDSGPGVPKESLEHLFDRLYRVDKSRSRAQGGSGLGLSICKSIVDNLGGEIRATNSISVGLRIEIVLPLI